jgi:hypothetical protein
MSTSPPYFVLAWALSQLDHLICFALPKFRNQYYNPMSIPLRPVPWTTYSQNPLDVSRKEPTTVFPSFPMILLLRVPPTGEAGRNSPK